MEEEREQKELFEFQKPKRPLRGLGKIFSGAAFDGRRFALVLTLDRVIFISIGLIMLMVVIYALGVERGRSVNVKEAPPAMPRQLARPIVTPAAPQVAAAPVAVAAKSKQLPAYKPYTIIAVTFSKSEWAANEASRLKKDGFDAYVSFSAPYYVVCIGAFGDKESPESQQALKKVRRVYKDARFKLK